MMKSGNACVCALACCSDSDCQNGDSCMNNQCVTPCDQALCIAFCLIQSKLGICVGPDCNCL
jgi:hypothetical protein